MKPRHVLLMISGCAIAAGSVCAQTYPVKPIRVIIGAGAGGGVDTISRITGQRLSERWGQQVVLENRAGGGGVLASEQVARAAPDGYMLLTMSISYAVIPAMHKDLAYDPMRDFVPVGVLVNAPNILVVHPSLPVKSVKDLVALARAHPGTLTYASSGNGGAANLALEAFKLATKTDIVHVPYKGTGPGVTDLIAGRISLSSTSVVSALEFVKLGKLRALATVGAKRSLAAPDLPTVAEAGVPGYAVDVWYAMFAPAAVPKDILAQLNGEITRALALPETKARLAPIGLEPAIEPLDKTNAYIQSEMTKWAKVVRAANIKPE
ncbi:MAG: tripartite tricarboxylate transporter substrate binding protein [Burkholderiales bacterium]